MLGKGQGAAGRLGCGGAWRTVPAASGVAAGSQVAQTTPKPPILPPHTHAARPRSGAPWAWAWACASPPCHRPGLQWGGQGRRAWRWGRCRQTAPNEPGNTLPRHTHCQLRASGRRSRRTSRELVAGTSNRPPPKHSHSPAPARARQMSRTAANLAIVRMDDDNVRWEDGMHARCGVLGQAHAVLPHGSQAGRPCSWGSRAPLETTMPWITAHQSSLMLPRAACRMIAGGKRPSLRRRRGVAALRH